MTPYHDALIHNHLEVAEFLRLNGGTIVHREIGYNLCDLASKGNI